MCLEQSLPATTGVWEIELQSYHAADRSSHTLSTASCTDWPCLRSPFGFLPRISNFLRLYSLSNKFGLLCTAVSPSARFLEPFAFGFCFAIAGNLEMLRHTQPNTERKITKCSSSQSAARYRCGRHEGKRGAVPLEMPFAINQSINIFNVHSLRKPPHAFGSHIFIKICNGTTVLQEVQML